MPYKKLQVYDVDGTLVDSTHRYRFIENPDGSRRIDLEYWRANEHRAMDDTLLPLAEQYQEELKDPSVYVVIATSRVWDQYSQQFLQEVLGEPDRLIHRWEGQKTRAHLLKGLPIKRMMNLVQFRSIKEGHFYEDNPDVCHAVAAMTGLTPVVVESEQWY